MQWQVRFGIYRRVICTCSFLHSVNPELVEGTTNSGQSNNQLTNESIHRIDRLNEELPDFRINLEVRSEGRRLES